MLKYLFIFGLVVFYPNITTQAKPNHSDFQKNAVYTQILKNHPGIDKNYALKLSYAIQKASREYNLQARKLAAIYAQESMYKLNTKNCTPEKCTDFGISQIHYRTIKLYGFDKRRLLTDLEYSVRAGAIVLSDIKKAYSKKEKNWWTRYNASNFSKRKEYEKLVTRYL